MTASFISFSIGKMITLYINTNNQQNYMYVCVCVHTYTEYIIVMSSLHLIHSFLIIFQNHILQSMS